MTELKNSLVVPGLRAGAGGSEGRSRGTLVVPGQWASLPQQLLRSIEVATLEFVRWEHWGAWALHLCHFL